MRWGRGYWYSYACPTHGIKRMEPDLIYVVDPSVLLVLEHSRMMVIVYFPPVLGVIVTLVGGITND